VLTSKVCHSLLEVTRVESLRVDPCYNPNAAPSTTAVQALQYAEYAPGRLAAYSLVASLSILERLQQKDGSSCCRSSRHRSDVNADKDAFDRADIIVD
jgi:hypothetical protein